MSGQFLSEVIKQVHHAAPRVKLEWLSTPREVYDAVSEGLVDIAHLGGETRLPDGLEQIEVPCFQWTSFVRAGHPALVAWGREAWSRYSHVQVSIANGSPSHFDRPADSTTPERHIGALISEFSSLGALLANSDLIGTFPRILMAWDMKTYGLRPLVPPVLLHRFRTRFFWSSRLANDPASMWIRDIVLQVYRDINNEAERMVERELAE